VWGSKIEVRGREEYYAVVSCSVLIFYGYIDLLAIARMAHDGDHVFALDYGTGQETVSQPH
jgi:uncharacterized protein (UPF0548 family)